ncbi:MAG: UDP-N-acetylmuramoyl-L-alanyl-D-glutamate--2,6-diaminopimelate ligase, partial [Erysipelotrichia bacterium]|nr:UDP-N-acetylmuramoyl-L-alanyl-D-glutamate--2,6-diaminopimelate ligase [Erysipelotrichia bacterium]
MKLSAIFENAPAIEITSLHTDSRTVKKQGMFFCLDGFVTNGHKYIQKAIEHGAVAIVHSEDIEHYDEHVTYIKVANVNDTLNKVVAKFYNHPSEKLLVFGVTGTNGKSSVTNIINDIYNHFAPCGYIGTIAITYQNVKLAPDLTTPDAILMNQILKDMVDADVKAVALEVSSHGLEQGRVDSIDFDVAIFTNFTYDHLDFHGTMENYFNAKTKLFKGMKKDGVSILNIDDPKFNDLYAICPTRVVTYGIEKEATYRANHIKLGTASSSFTLLYQEKEYEVTTNLVAMYNIYNLLAAIAAIVESGVAIEEVLAYVNGIKQIEGRLEMIEEGQPFQIIVDFAHTPDGLEKIYEYAKEITPDGSDIIAVFGSAGKRDKAKRKVFGEISDKYCDLIILTEDDPRDENPKDIANEIKEGIKNTKNVFIEDRYDAIRMAIESANVADTVLILGKGDEVFMYHEEGRVAWIGDHNAAKEIIHKYYLDED